MYVFVFELKLMKRRDLERHDYHTSVVLTSTGAAKGKCCSEIYFIIISNSTIQRD